jgi:hypothetical protein
MTALQSRPLGSVPIASLALAGFNLPLLIYGDSIRGYGLGAILILGVYGLLACLLREPLAGRRSYVAALLPFAAIASVQVLLGNAALLLVLGIAASTIAALRRRWGLVAWILGCGLAAGLSLLPYLPALAVARRDWSVIVTYPFDGHRIWYTFLDALGRRPILLSWLIFLGGALASSRLVGAPASSRPVRRHLAGKSPSKEIPDFEPREPNLAPNTLFAALVFLLAPLATGVFLGVLGYRPRDWYYLPLIALLASAVDTLLGIGRAARSAGILPAGPPASSRWSMLYSRTLPSPAGKMPADRPAGSRRSTPRRWVSVGIVAAVVIAVCAQARPLSEKLLLPASNADVVARQVAATATRDDLVVVIPWYYGVSFDRYYHGSAEWLTLPGIADHRMHRYDLLKRRLSADRPIDDVLSAVASHLRAGHRVWVIGDFEPQPRGRSVAPMPPAPRSPAGWHDWDYIENWSLQFEAFIADHARRTTRVAVVPAVEASRLENLSLFEVEGWAEDRDGRERLKRQ